MTALPHPVPPAEPKLDRPELHWEEDQAPAMPFGARNPRPRRPRVVVADDRITADQAYRLACEGTGLLWRGDYQNARQLLQAMTRRVDKRPRKPADTLLAAFNQHRMAQAQRARILGMLLIPSTPAMASRCAARRTRGWPANRLMVRPTRPTWPLRELLGLIGAYEWRRKGVEIPALGGDRIHPHYGVFSPVRGEYVDLVAQARCRPATRPSTSASAPACCRPCWSDAAWLVIATDQDARACARETWNAWA